MFNYIKKFLPYTLIISFLSITIACSEDSPIATENKDESVTASSSIDYSNQVLFKGSNNSSSGKTYEVLPGPAVINPAMNPTPFSDNITMTDGSFDLTVVDNVDVDSPTSTDEVTSVNIEFTANDGKRFKIDEIRIIHKPDGAGDHPFFGGVGLNKMMHGNTGIGVGLMPKMLAYITLWGKTDLKDASTNEVVASDRIVHIMVASKVRNDDLGMITDVEDDKSDHDTWMAETHVILIPQDMEGNPSPVPRTDHGFIHMMWENVDLKGAERDWKKVYEILPGPAAVNSAMSPTPFSNKVAFGSGSYSFDVNDITADDSETSEDAVENVNIKYQRPNGEMFMIDNIQIIHKPDGMGDHTFYGGVGLNKMMHGNTGIGIDLMPKMLAYITLWGKTDLKNATTGEVVASDRIVHIMVASKVRNDNLSMITDVGDDKSDHDTWMAETHVILIPQDMEGNPSPVPGTDHGFIHMMWESVELKGAVRDWKKVYEILPGPAVVNTAMSPTPFSNKVAFGSGSYSFDVNDITTDDSETSEDAIENVTIKYQRPNGEMFMIDNIQIIHKAEGSGDHTFFGGVGLNKEMHGNTGIGNGLMPKMLSYITLWGLTDLKDGSGNVIASNRLIHIMVSSRTRTPDLKLITDLENDVTDHSDSQIETHIIFPPLDMEGNMSPVSGTGHGFLHLMFENVSLATN